MSTWLGRELPPRSYEVLTADPPWSYTGQQDKWGAAAKFYDTVTDEDLLSLPMADLLDRRGVLLLWATCPRLDFAVDCIRGWGLHFRGVAFIWIKTRLDGEPVGAQGVRASTVKPTCELVLEASHEMVLTASHVKKGRPMPLGSEKVVQTIFAPKGRHSEKPSEFRRRVEALYPNASRLEMFARSTVPGWDAWGDEAGVYGSPR